MATTLISGVQYSGIWNLSSQIRAKADGTWSGFPLSFLFSWGDRNDGQLGQNTFISGSSPVQVGSVNWKFADGGNQSNIAITTDNRMFTWGGNSSGELGQNGGGNRSSPVQVGALTTWDKAAIGSAFCAAIKTDGTLWMWGANSVGQLGQNNTTYKSSPVQVGALTNWREVACAGNSTFGIDTDGKLYSWGWNVAEFAGGVLGLNDAINRSSPVQVGALTNWSKVFSAQNSSNCFAIKTDGTLWAWGLNGAGILGQNNTVARSSPVQVGALTNWSKAADSGEGFVQAIKTDGTLWSWGLNEFGQLGQNNTTYRSSPVQVGSGTNWSDVACGRTVIAITTGKELYAWGRNSLGQLGQNDTIDRSSPVQVGSLSIWSKVGTGLSHSLAITDQIT
jgi:alpha-tubulin suppressor-like RCC1 family protein